MARYRTIKPEFWTSEQIVELSTNARLLFIGIWNFCDDAGIHPASAKALKMQIFPGDNFSINQIGEWVAEIIAQGLMIEYEVDKKAYWMVTGWAHQRIDRPNCRYPKPNSPNGRRALAERSTQERKKEREEGSRVEKSREERNKNTHSAPAQVSSENGQTKSGDVDEEEKTQSPPVAAGPPTPEELVWGWCKSNLDELRKWADEEGFTPAHGTARNEIKKFSAWYAGPKAKPEFRQKFEADPVGFFRAEFKGWIRRTVEQSEQRRPVGKAGKRPATSAPAFTPKSEADIIKIFRGRYGADIADRLSTQNLAKLAQAANQQDFEDWMIGFYNRLKKDTAPARAPSGPASIGSLLTKPVTS